MSASSDRREYTGGMTGLVVMAALSTAIGVVLAGAALLALISIWPSAIPTSQPLGPTTVYVTGLRGQPVPVRPEPGGINAVGTTALPPYIAVDMVCWQDFSGLPGTDGQMHRWFLIRLPEANPDRLPEVDWVLAEYVHNQRKVDNCGVAV